MAKKTTVTVTDDLDGSANAKEVTFRLNGESWTMDLSTKNRGALEKALKPYIAKATKQGRRRSSAMPRKSIRRPPRAATADGPRVGQEQRSPGQRPRPGQCHRSVGLRRRALGIADAPRCWCLSASSRTGLSSIVRPEHG